MPKESQILIKVQQDPQKIPEKIDWSATDSDIDGEKPADSFSLSFWDKEEKNTLSIDLWTKSMTVQDMSQFTFQKLVKMAETYERATNLPVLGDQIRDFARQFMEKVEETLKAENKND